MVTFAFDATLLLLCAVNITTQYQPQPNNGQCWSRRGVPVE